MKDYMDPDWILRRMDMYMPNTQYAVQLVDGSWLSCEGDGSYCTTWDIDTACKYTSWNDADIASCDVARALTGTCGKLIPCVVVHRVLED